MNEKYNDAVNHYLEHCHHVMNNLPLDVQREVSRYREIDCRFSHNIFKLTNFIKKTDNSSLAQEHLQQLINESTELSIRKLNITECLSEMVSTELHTLNMNHKEVETAKLHLINSDSIDIQNTNNSNNRPKRNVTKPSTTLNESLAINAHFDRKSSTNQNKIKNTSNKKSKVKPTKIKKLVSGSESCDGDDQGDGLQPIYCVCEKTSYGDMIGCDNDLCPLEWCHFDCVSISRKPRGKWYCPFCCKGTDSKTMMSKKKFLKKLEKYNKKKEEN